MAILIDSVTAFREAAARLGTLLDSDARRAITEARQLRGKDKLKELVHALRAGIFIDGGTKLKDPETVTEGISVFRKLAAKQSDNPTPRYNLANGLSGLSRLDPVAGAEWYVSTYSNRREARRLFQDVAEATRHGTERAMALINLGNELDLGFRWVEAYDRWVSALSADPSNGVAALVASRMLLRRMTSEKSHPIALHRVAGYYARLASRKEARVESIAGSKAFDMAKKLPTFKSTWRPRKLGEIRDELGRFVAQHRLALVGTVEGLDLRRRRWDDLYISRITEKVDRGVGVPPVFAMFNQLKADYCAARWLAFSWDHHPPRDTSVYMDTLDYSVYGVAPSLLQLSQRAALDILDRVAVCANEYFDLHEKPADVYFRSFWRERNGTGAWRAVWNEELDKRNPGIVALGELASDLEQGGMLALQRELRNVGTHRFGVLHDMGTTPSRSNVAIDHQDVEGFRGQTIAALQIVRSAILYLRDAISASEARRPYVGLSVEMDLVPHHYIRGEG